MVAGGAAAINCEQESAPLLGIRQIRPPTNFDQRPFERPLLPGWPADELSRRVGQNRSALSYATRRAPGAR